MRNDSTAASATFSQLRYDLPARLDQPSRGQKIAAHRLRPVLPVNLRRDADRRESGAEHRTGWVSPLLLESPRKAGAPPDSKRAHLVRSSPTRCFQSQWPYPPHRKMWLRVPPPPGKASQQVVAFWVHHQPQLGACVVVAARNAVRWWPFSDSTLRMILLQDSGTHFVRSQP